MKKLFVLVFITLMSTSVFSTNENPAKEQIRTKIVELLGNPNFVLDKEVKTTVEFLINKNGEIVILNVNCKTEQVCHYVKSRLNYKFINNELKLKNHIYNMPLTIQKSSSK
ncbi:hypothetical protein Q4517_02400 [Tenacibaculum sp. 1_MG-2023]|uniref:hypothetical protein n=1 Tax=Tenacibaculum sp. 1_MG-2023 TaxID=3062653 RepID=UPI0026E23AEA|nr:hypothetical protein [Tenacibaculum sp. 1_MG-2023]MDO6674397.1 hypothetical protein [Tenacibaculum sp. 1_MG-2023]